MEEKAFKSAEGTCIISEEVIATIACTAAMDVEGVAAMALRPDIRGMITGGANGKSVKVSGGEGAMTLDVYITMAQGFRIPEVAEEVQREVKVAVQSMTGKPVTRVNVHVSGLKLDEEKK